MSYGILFISNNDHFQATNSYTDFNDFDIWAVEENKVIKKLSSLSDLNKNVIWISNISEPSNNTEIIENWKVKYGLTVLRKEWLSPDLEFIASKLGVEINQDGQLLLLSIIRLISFVKKYSGRDINLVTSLMQQIPELFFNPLGIQEKENNEVIENYLDLKKNIFRHGARFKVDTLPGYQRVEMNLLAQIDDLRNQKIPNGNWTEVLPIELDTNSEDIYLFGIKKNSIKAKDNIDMSLIEAIELTFLQPNHNSSLVWLNNNEFDIVNRYFHLIPSKFLTCDKYITPKLSFNLIDSLSFTKSWFFSLQMQKFFDSPCTTNLDVWIRTRLVRNCFLKAEELIKQGIALKFFDYKYFHFFYKNENIGTSIHSCLQSGLEPNIALFHKS